MASIRATSVDFGPDAGQPENLAWNRDGLSGYIFMCNGKTKADCYRYRVFGLPATRLNVVEKIKPRTMLFLFDFDLKLLYGIYAATSAGGLGMEPTAFGGNFSAQVRFEIFKDCLPLPENAFKHAIKDNYNTGLKFRQELSNEQVIKLMSLFRPLPKLPADLSASYDQYLAQQKLLPIGIPGNYQHNQQVQHLMHVPYASSANILSTTPAVQSLVPRYQSNAYVLEDNQQPSVCVDSVFLQQNPYGRYPFVQTNGDTSSAPQLHSSKPQTAAYWVAVASKDPKKACSFEQRMPSASPLEDVYVPVSTMSGLSYNSSLENSEMETTGSSMVASDCSYNLASAASSAPYSNIPLLYQGPSYRPVHFQSSSLATVQSFDIVKQMFSGHDRRLPPRITDTGAGNWPNHSVAASSYMSVPESSEKEVDVPSSDTYAFPHYIAVSAANALVPASVQLPSHISGPPHGYAHTLSSSGAAAYWTAMASQGTNQVQSAALRMSSEDHTGYDCEVASDTNEMLQAYDLVPSQVPASSRAAAYWTCLHEAKQ